MRPASLLSLLALAGCDAVFGFEEPVIPPYATDAGPAAPDAPDAPDLPPDAPGPDAGPVTMCIEEDWDASFGQRWETVDAGACVNNACAAYGDGAGLLTIELGAQTGREAVRLRAPLDLTGAEVSVWPQPWSPTAPFAWGGIGLELPDGTVFALEHATQGTVTPQLRLVQQSGGVTTLLVSGPFDATNHAGWRLRAVAPGGMSSLPTLLVETRSAVSSWTLFGQAPLPAPLTSVRLRLEAGTATDAASQVGLFNFNNLAVCPGSM